MGASMALIEQAEALAIIGNDRLNGVYKSITKAWESYLEYPIDKRIIHSDSCKAHIIHCHMVHEATKFTEQVEGVAVLERRKLYMFVMDAKLAVRFKKFDESFISKNQPTKQVRDFRGQLQLPGVEASYNLEAGYILDQEGQLKAVHLVCPNGLKSNYWEILLTDTGSKSIVSDLFAKKVDEEDASKVNRIKRKKEATIIQIGKENGKP